MGCQEDVINLLVKNLAKKDKQAFHKLYLLYANDVYSFSRSLVKSDDLAKEVLQDVFLKIWMNASQIDSTKNFKSYLLTIARNESLNLIKKAANDIKLAQKVFNETNVVSGPYQKLRDKELKEVKKSALNRLPEKRKQIFLMSREEGKSYIEISEELGISVNTVKVQMSKALSTLREYLIKHSDVFTLSILFIWIGI